MQIDVAKAFDKVHRDGLTSFAQNIIAAAAPVAAMFTGSLYKGDKVMLSYGKPSKTISVKSGIRQGDPL